MKKNINTSETARTSENKNVGNLPQMNRYFTRDLIKQIAGGLIIYDSSGEIIYANSDLISLLGSGIEQMYGEDFSRHVPVEYAEIFRNRLESGVIRAEEMELLHMSGLKIPVKIKFGELHHKSETLKFLSVEDLSKINRYRDALNESGKVFRKIIENSTEVIAIIDENWIIQYISDSSEKLFGFSPYESVGNSILDYIHPDDRGYVEKKLLACISSCAALSVAEFRYMHKDGSWRDIQVNASNILNDPLINGIILHARDISDLKKAEEQAAHYQLYDTHVTRLPNISLLKTRLQLEIVKVQERKQDKIFGVMSLGIDRYKNINNLHGRETGDMLLNKIGERLKNSFRGDDLVARYGGDVFIILLSYIARSYDLKDIIKKTQELFSGPFLVGTRSFNITASMGISVFPVDGDEVEQLINNSQAAMYRAKEAGTGGYCLFDPKMHDELIYNLRLEEELKDAITKGEFEAFYQPKFDAMDRLSGAETLIRWRSPKRGLIPPGIFIPLVEKNGMIVDIGYIILRKACEQIRIWAGMGFSKRVAINFAPAQFKDPELLDTIEKIILETGVNREMVEFEITESGIIENSKEALMKLFKIRTLGIKIAMDDFGTGLSSLSNLIAYPIDVLKIDKSFVDKLPGNEEAKIVVNSIISLANNLGYEVVAEGIESSGQLEYLKEKKCEFFQGYYYSEPLTASDFEKKYITV